MTTKRRGSPAARLGPGQKKCAPAKRIPPVFAVAHESAEITNPDNGG